MSKPTTLPELVWQRLQLCDRLCHVDQTEGELWLHQWWMHAGSIASRLAAYGVQQDDVILVAMSNRNFIDYACTYLAIQRLGAIPAVVPNAGYGLERYAQRVTPKLIITDSPASKRRTTDIYPVIDATARSEHGGGSSIEDQRSTFAELLFTSGTTKEPKPVLVSHSNLLSRIGRDLQREPIRTTIVAHAFPVGTNAAQTMLLEPLRAEAPIVLTADFEPLAFANLVAARGAQAAVLVPAMGSQLLAAGLTSRDMPTLVRIRFSAAALPPALALELAARFPNATIENLYTTTEAWPTFTVTTFDPTNPNSVGHTNGRARVLTQSGSRARPMEPGFVQLLGHSGRYSQVVAPPPDVSSHGDLWIDTGDIGYIDRAGKLCVVDRAAHFINVGGAKVSRAALEAALMAHRAVTDVAAVPMPHEPLGETVGIAVVLAYNPSGSEQRALLEELRGLARSALGPDAVPRLAAFVSAIPRSPAGKVLTEDVRRDISKFIDGTYARSVGSFEDDLERRLAEMWKAALGNETITSESDFFALGGDSFALLSINTAIRDEYGIELDMVQQLEAETLADLAALVRRAAASAKKRRP